MPDRDLDGFPRPLQYVLLGEHTALLCRQEECGLANGETNGFVYIYLLDMFQLKRSPECVEYLHFKTFVTVYTSHRFVHFLTP